MNPSEPKPKKGLTCRDCGADNPPDAKECWLCLRSDWRQDAADRPDTATAPPGRGLRIATHDRLQYDESNMSTAPLGTAWYLSVWAAPSTDQSEPTTAPPGVGPRVARIMVLIATTYAVGCGIVLQEPLAVPMEFVGFWICATPAWVITGKWANRRDRRGQAMSAIHKTLMIVVLTFLLPLLLVAAVAIALSVLCTTVLLPPPNH